MYKSVLVVDDDPTQIAILNAYFASMKIAKMYHARDPLVALDILREHQEKIDWVISDLQMPNMDGLEFLRHLKELDYKGRLVIFSGLGETLVDHAARLAKMHQLQLVGQLTKPLTKSSMDTVFLKTKNEPITEVQNDDVVITREVFLHAMRAGEICPFYQPKVEIKTGRITGAECLARWIRPDGKFVSPVQFIKFAEDNDCITELTFSLFQAALDDIRVFLQSDANQQFAINLSPNMVLDITLPDTLRTMVGNAGISASNISFEVTENTILDLDVTTLEVLSRLRIHGFEVAIDDFGTGSSNIQTLRDFPYSELKIDRSFVSTATINQFSAKTVYAAFSFAKELNMRTVAEGVEHQEDWNFVRDAGIDHMQGYIVSKPLKAMAYIDFLSANKNGVSIPPDTFVA